jgi:hypothetical protein
MSSVRRKLIFGKENIELLKVTLAAKMGKAKNW